MSSLESPTEFARLYGRHLLEAARASIVHAVRTGDVLVIDPLESEAALQIRAATFVSLHRGNDLLGCVGSLSAKHPIIVDVVENAAAVVLHDPRCPVLGLDELASLSIDISLLAPSEPMNVASEQDLIDQLRPGIDGVTFEDRGRRGTFLPVVWESVPNPRAFVRELKRKAGLPLDIWSPTIRVSRYTTVAIREKD